MSEESFEILRDVSRRKLSPQKAETTDDNSASQETPKDTVTIPLPDDEFWEPIK